MKITILTVGKIKERFFKDAIDEYSKRLSKYCTLEIKEVSDEKTAESMSEAEENIVKDKEASRLLKYIKEGDYVITLEIEGVNPDSPSLADKINKLCISGKSSITFIIGGSLGLSDEIKNLADYKLSFSKMTFPHQLMRVILLEQLYRSFRIINNEPYHK